MMNHDQYREWLHLAMASELDDEDALRLHAHLDTCEACQAEFAELTQLMTTIGGSGVAEPSEEMLWEARRNLSDALGKEPSISSVLARVTQNVAPAGSGTSTLHGRGWSEWFTGFRVALTGLAGAAAGFLVAFMVFGGPTPEQVAVQSADTVLTSGAREMGPPSIANIRFANQSGRRDVMEVEYDLVRPVRLRASADDEQMQRLLTYAMVNESNTGVRLRAISALEEYADQPVTDPAIKAAFIETLASDANPAVRKQALRVLQRMPFDSVTRDACLYVLKNDTNAALRIAAINLLAEATLEGYDPGEELYDVLKSDESNYIRFHTGAFIQEVSEDVQ